jgi:uncharacterized membrane protein (DUF2068 family)
MSQKKSAGLLLAIALFKLVKAAALIALGVAALELVHDGDSFGTMRRVVSELKIDPDNRYVNRAISSISGLDETRLRELGVGTFVYAAVFLVEGTGLLLRKRWAEYLTIVVTGSFIPFEVYELVHKPSALKVVGLVLNVLIVVYLVLRRWQERHEQTHTRRSHGQGVA